MNKTFSSRVWYGTIVCVTANAQSWPTKPVRVIVNVAPGGVADVTARVLGARLTETLGQPFVVENRAGGDGYIGFEAVGRADADGHTLLYSPGSSMMIAPHIVNRRGPRSDQGAGAGRGDGRACRSTSSRIPNVPDKNFKEFLAYARANPGQAQLRHAGERHLAAHRHRGVQPRGQGQAEPHSRTKARARR